MYNASSHIALGDTIASPERRRRHTPPTLGAHTDPGWVGGTFTIQDKHADSHSPFSRQKHSVRSTEPRAKLAGWPKLIGAIPARDSGGSGSRTRCALPPPLSDLTLSPPFCSSRRQSLYGGSRAPHAAHASLRREIVVSIRKGAHEIGITQVLT